jgi:hypothetical protein
VRKNPFLVAVTVCGACLLSFSLGHCAPPGDHDPHQDHADAASLFGALPGLTDPQRAAFAEGRQKFAEVETVAEGLGPVFNGRSCAECHAHPIVGGSSPDLETSVVVRIGAMRDGMYDSLAAYGGPVLQRRSIKEDNPACPIVGEQVPPRQSSFPDGPRRRYSGRD